MKNGGVAARGWHGHGGHGVASGYGSQLISTELQKEVTHLYAVDEGAGLYNEFKSSWGSSTRSELAAVIVACMSDMPGHIATDSKALVDKAEWMGSRGVESHASTGTNTRTRTKDK